MNKEQILKIIEKNKNLIKQARQMLDSVTAVALAGAATDKKARDLISSGTLTTISSGIVLTGLSVTGLVGPVIMGVAIAPTLAKISMVTGLTSLVIGFVRGFRNGISHVETIKEEARKSINQFTEAAATKFA